MTLADFMRTMQDTDYIKIAAKHGAGFLFAGTVAAVKKEMPATVSKYKLKTYVDYAQKRLKYEETCQRHPREKARLKTLYERAKKAYEDFRPFTEREIIETFYAAECVDDINAVVTVVYIPGNESGRWGHIGADGKGAGAS